MKTYIFMRRDLKMRRGKEIAQACHAVLGLDLEDAPTVCLKCFDESELNKAIRVAIENKLDYYCVRDAGHTEVSRGTLTCAAIRAPEGLYNDFSLY